MLPKRYRIGILVALFLPVALIVVVRLSISTSNQACSFHPECAVYIFRWVHIKDEEKAHAPKTFTEWFAPRNMTEKVSQLATTSDLEMVQHINRRLAVLPEELHRYTNLQYLWQIPVAQCRTGMCYNARMEPITCNGNVLSIEMRKRQIQACIGPSCDPKYEARLS
uniref:WLGC domain-containing protein n=1 Tax=Globisporangium ultimum (strain ATCC 200006 / CBS 805.95 / DAOM BR144) TaxID=431595 RepID=K3WG13_GLOUD